MVVMASNREDLSVLPQVLIKNIKELGIALTGENVIDYTVSSQLFYVDYINKKSVLWYDSSMQETRNVYVQLAQVVTKKLTRSKSISLPNLHSVKVTEVKGLTHSRNEFKVFVYTFTTKDSEQYSMLDIIPTYSVLPEQMVLQLKKKYGRLTYHNNLQ